MDKDYSAVPLARKLGVTEEMRVSLIGAPPEALEALGSPPAGSHWRRRMGPGTDLVLWWPADLADLRTRMPKLAPAVTRPGLWIMWPKRSSGVRSDVTEQAVREAGLAAGLVDNKVASFDATWSALRFVPRRPGPARPEPGPGHGQGGPVRGASRGRQRVGDLSGYPHDGSAPSAGGH